MTNTPPPVTESSPLNDPAWPHSRRHQWTNTALGITDPVPDILDERHANLHRQIEALILAAGGGPAPIGGYDVEDGHARRHDWETDWITKNPAS